MKNFHEIFKELARSKELTITHVIQNAILRGMKIGNRTTDKEIAASVSQELAEKFLRNSFTPITRKLKLDNGRMPFDTVYLALHRATDDMMRFFDNDAEVEQFKAIVAELIKIFSVDSPYCSSEYAKRQYVYIFVRQDIAPEYQAVQACHVAAKMGQRGCQSTLSQFSNEQFDQLYMTLVGVPDIKGLQIAAEDIKAIGSVVYTFHEPDIGNELTAVASSPIRASARKRLLSYKLLKFENTRIIPRMVKL